MKARRKYILYNRIKLREKNEKERNSMKLGFVSAILDTWSYEEMMDFASDHGFECVEIACWPQGKAERRYAGVSHIDVDKVLADKRRNFFSCILSKHNGWRFRKESFCSRTFEKCNPCKP